MTSWAAEPRGGRARGPRGLVRAWIEVLVRPTRFFRMGVSPGDQGPGLTFAMAVVAVEEISRLALLPDVVPQLVGGTLASGALLVGLATLLVTPLALHLVAGVQILLLRPLVPDRAGVSETVQVLAYAAAPAVFVGVPEPTIRVLGCFYGTWLLVVGLATVHETSRWRAAAAGAIPAVLVFGYGFRGVAALGALSADLRAATHLI